MKKWVVRFRVITPGEYHVPLYLIPIEETRVEAENENEAWEKWVTDPYACPRDWYNKIEIYEYKQ